MDIVRFAKLFEKEFPAGSRAVPDSRLRTAIFRYFLDPCPDVPGMVSPRKLKLLQLAVSLLPSDGSECYLEVGTYQGKSLIGALKTNPGRKGVCCDNFSEFDVAAGTSDSLTHLRRNLDRHGLTSRVSIFSEDFRTLFRRSEPENLMPPVGVYFYDGAHDDSSQYEGIRLVEPLLSDTAVVIVDDWRRAADSGSFAEEATRRAMSDSAHHWSIQWVLPARANGDYALWWNGVAVLTFARTK